jgi:hypothetical protein
VKPSPCRTGRRLQFDGVAVAQAKPILQIAVAHEHRVVLVSGDRGVAQAPFEFVHLGLHREKVGEGLSRFAEDGPPGVVQSVLRQVANGQRRRLQDRP